MEDPCWYCNYLILISKDIKKYPNFSKFLYFYIQFNFTQLIFIMVINQFYYYIFQI